MTSRAKLLALLAAAAALFSGTALWRVTRPSPTAEAPRRTVLGPSAAHGTALERADRGAADAGADGDRSGATTDAGGSRFDAAGVYGRLAAPAGEPVAGAALALSELGASAPRARTESNPEGRFRFASVEPFTEHALAVDAPGFLAETFVVESGVETLLTLRRAMAIEGRVLDADERPLAGARVTPSPSGEENDAQASARSGADGRYLLPRVAADAVQVLEVALPDRLPEQFRVRTESGRESGYDLRMPRALGRLVLLLQERASTRPLGDLEVELVPGFVERTDAAGEIALAIGARTRTEAGDHRLYLEAEGWLAVEVLFTVPGDGSVRRLVVPMDAGATLAGTVRDAAGTPVPGATVTLAPSASREGGLRAPPGMRYFHGRTVARTGADGRYVLAGLLPGLAPARLIASHPERSPVVRDDVALPEGGRTGVLDFTLADGGTLEGTVTIDGQPGAAWVFWRSRSGSGHARSNDRGAYRLPGVATGTVLVWAERDLGAWSDTEEVPLSVASGATLRHDIALLSDDLTITGRVQDDAGTPVGGAEVVAWPLDGDADRSGLATSAADGGFELRVPAAAGTLYSLRVDTGTRAGALDGVAAGARGVVVRLPRAGALRLCVHDARSGVPVPGVAVYWRPEGGSGFRRVRGDALHPGAEGALALELPPGMVDLRVLAADTSYAPGGLDGVTVGEVRAPSTAALALSAGAELELAFVATDPRQRSIRPALGRGALALQRERDPREPFALDDWQRDLARALRRGVDADERARWRGLAPGRYRLGEVPRALTFSPAAFDVRAGEARSLEVRWGIDGAR